MADERCAHPEEGPPPRAATDRTSGRWLDRATAERLLRGDHPGNADHPDNADQPDIADHPDNAVAPAHLARADQLARALGSLAALAVPSVPDDEELPGEAAALAAFRKVHAERGPVLDVTPAAPRAQDGADTAVLVRIGGPAPRPGPARRRGPVRLGLAAALAVTLVGGLVAAGLGALPAPFDRQDPSPATASSPAAATPGPSRSPAPPAPESAASAGSGAGTPVPPDAAAGARPGPGGSPGGTSPAVPPAVPDRAPAGRPGAEVTACRAFGAGRALDPERRRALEGRAGGRALVRAYCARLLDPRHPSNPRPGGGKPDGKKGSGEKGDKKGGGKKDGGKKGDGKKRDRVKGDREKDRERERERERPRSRGLGGAWKKPGQVRDGAGGKRFPDGPRTGPRRTAPSRV
ncbi:MULTISPECIES: hypothetical protein [unclassified Streptomyces]|uniref:hypothetical protein n=1 Tax=unclassified Streptomyces TaxID=2593676 RepID=UPI003826B80B